MMRLCLYLSRTQGGFSFAPLRNKMGFSTWSVFYTFLRWLWPRGAWAPKNGLTRFTARCFATFLALRPNLLKEWFSISFRACLTPFALAQSTLCLCTKNGITHFTTECFAEQFPCSALGFRNSTPPLFLLFMCSSNAKLSVSYRGGYSRSLWLACLPCWQSPMGVLHRIQCAQRVNEGFTKLTASDQLSCSAKISYAPFVGFGSQSLMCWQSRHCLLFSYPQVSWVKQCFIEETCTKPFFFWKVW